MEKEYHWYSSAVIGQDQILVVEKKMLIALAIYNVMTVFI